MALDDGFKQSDAISIRLEYRIMKEYKQAYKEMAEKTEKYFDKFAKQDEIKRQAYEAGKISKKEYAQWRQNKMLTGERWQAMRDTLATDLSNYDKIAMKYVRDTAIDVYALNMNYGTYALEKASGINTSFTLYNHDAVKVLLKDNPQLLPKYANPKVNIPLDKRWNMQHINSAITQGILQGESIPQVAKRLENVVGMDERAALRNARTAMTSAQNAGRLDAAKRMAARGVGVKKGWLATLDNVTRDSHVDVDGEVVDLDKNFSNGLQYPADGAGAPEEVYNCRCRLTTEYDKYKTNWSDTTLRNTDKFKAESYDAWKKAARNRLEKKAQKKMVAKAEADKLAKQAAATEAYKLLKQSISNEGIEYNEVQELDHELTEKEIIAKLGGGDKTDGSCSSLSYAYIANKNGLDVTDFRGGKSCEFFSKGGNIHKMAQLEGIEKQTYMVKKEASDVAKKLKELNLPYGKEYRLGCGGHAAIIRNTEHGYEYLELQSPFHCGWMRFDEKNKFSYAKDENGEWYINWDCTPCKMADTLYERFGCRRTQKTITVFGEKIKLESQMMLTEVESYKDCKEFRDLLGYINTATNKQMKGVSGGIK